MGGFFEYSIAGEGLECCDGFGDMVLEGCEGGGGVVENLVLLGTRVGGVEWLGQSRCGES